jgi:pyrrolidone-carboxylate peptidase
VGISEDAGDFLCNFIFYKLMQRLGTEPQEERLLGGFLHVPMASNLETAKMTEAWRLIIARVVEERAALAGGQRMRGALPPTITIFTPPRYD